MFGAKLYKCDHGVDPNDTGYTLEEYTFPADIESPVGGEANILFINKNYGDIIWSIRCPNCNFIFEEFRFTRETERKDQITQAQIKEPVPTP